MIFLRFNKMTQVIWSRLGEQNEYVLWEVAVLTDHYFTGVEDLRMVFSGFSWFWVKFFNNYWLGCHKMLISAVFKSSTRIWKICWLCDYKQKASTFDHSNVFRSKYYFASLNFYMEFLIFVSCWKALLL